MQPSCTDRMKIARELLDFGVLGEAAETLSELRECGCHVGCDRWHRCLRLVERQWHFSKTPRRKAMTGA